MKTLTKKQNILDFLTQEEVDYLMNKKASIIKKFNAGESKIEFTEYDYELIDKILKIPNFELYFLSFTYISSVIRNNTNLLKNKFDLSYEFSIYSTEEYIDFILKHDLENGIYNSLICCELITKMFNQEYFKENVKIAELMLYLIPDVLICNSKDNDSTKSYVALNIQIDSLANLNTLNKLDELCKSSNENLLNVNEIIDRISDLRSSVKNRKGFLINDLVNKQSNNPKEWDEEFKGLFLLSFNYKTI